MNLPTGNRDILTQLTTAMAALQIIYGYMTNANLRHVRKSKDPNKDKGYRLILL